MASSTQQISSFIAIAFAYFICLTTSKESLWQKTTVPSAKFSSIDFVSEFNEWKVYFNKDYENTFDEFNVWKSNWKMINEWNINANHEYTLKMNQFSDLTSTQFKSRFMLTQSHKIPIANRKTIIPPINNPQDLPDSIDWSNITGPVQNQGQTGDAVGIAVTTSLQAFETVNTGLLSETLSVQELTDCVKPIITPNNCWEFIINNTGLCSKSSYPHTSDGQCEKDKCRPVDPITSYVDVDAIGNSTSLQYALLSGPVVIGVEADQSAFQFYSSGILSEGCGDNIDYYMVVVGYGEEGGNKYWKCQNSWGISWGENGFILLCRDCNQNNGNGICGILKEPSFAVL